MQKIIVTTLGGIVAPGLVADLVVGSRDELELIWFDGNEFFRGRELEYEGTLYRLASIPDGIQHLTRFARGVKEYYPERALLSHLAYLSQSYTQVTEDNSRLNGACIMATWIPEIILGSFTWYVVSPLPMQAMKTIQALCRRPIRDSTFISEFPPGHRPTLLSWVPENIAPDTCQAIFPGREAYEADSVSAKDLGIVKPFEEPILTDALQVEMAEDLQDCLQLFRLQHLHSWSLNGKVPRISARLLRWKIDNYSDGTGDFPTELLPTVSERMQPTFSTVPSLYTDGTYWV
jgi:hypothetical protein